MTAAAAASGPDDPQGASPWPVFWVASTATFLVSLDTTMLFAAFDALRHSFSNASAADLSWVLNAYTVVYATMLIPAGGLSDAHGRKRVFLVGVTLFLAASAACGLAGSVGWLIAARVLQAVGAALLTPASLSIVLAAFPQSRRAVVVSLWRAVGGLAAAVGPSAGSFVIDSFGWPWAFYINLPLGGLALWRGAALLNEISAAQSAAQDRHRRHGVDDAGGGGHHLGHRRVRCAGLDACGAGRHRLHWRNGGRCLCGLGPQGHGSPCDGFSGVHRFFSRGDAEARIPNDSSVAAIELASTCPAALERQDGCRSTHEDRPATVASTSGGR